MAIGKIGTIHKVEYCSKNFASGLTDVSIKILKPDGTLHDSGLMTEFSEVGFEGVYFFNMDTVSTDAEGEYSAVIISPTELHKAKMKVTMLDSFGGGSSGGISISDAEIEIDLSKKSIDIDMGIQKLDVELGISSISMHLDNSNIGMDLIKPPVELDLTNESINFDIDCA